ncbi:DUF1697 domain-containing protein [Streptomyces sp. DSM 42041]|uniref:DUF1697 domain-containing protein n=1 Tax=Streptomyces hazeniae TaxID=3075538 RepID=A0ABU2NXL9_9ACTN|nr:DUF1697 domain-containing protein [Streptomyces sp. DSM 42041]MDT0381262.1 DUF1697 domain-containing protein [Streptomyces sp. DSM 42041]
MTTGTGTTYVALLRGINVGGRRKVPMAELRELIDGLGWTGVRTHLQSGNAVFTVPPEGSGPPPRERLERAIADHFGFDVPCLLRTGRELRDVVSACPFPAADLDPAKLLVLFVEETPAAGHFAGVDAAAYAPDEFRHIGRAVYCWFPDGMGRSRLPAALEAVRPKLTATGRNWRTVTKLVEMTEQPA